MSDLAYHIATEHKLRFHEPSLTTTCSLPTCGMEPRLVYDESSLATVQAHHVAQVTEAAVREQIAAERDALAAAWDEGHQAGHEDARAVQSTYPEPTPNPYSTEGDSR